MEAEPLTPCPTCGQIDTGQTGERPCVDCGLPTLHDEQVYPLSEFREELKALINTYSLENESDTPDFILAQYLVECLAAFNTAVRHRDEQSPGANLTNQLSERNQNGD